MSGPGSRDDHARDGVDAPPPRGGKLVARLRDAIDALPISGDTLVERAALRVMARAEGVLDRLEGVSRTMEKVADAQLTLTEKLGPIVDDLGELVRLQLDDARARLLGRPPRRHERPPVVVDVPDDEGAEG
ncbi:MAG: hypothetical protein KC635_12405 [Myxococcales bacterium]|nr:hypothetical protein [Myxococcales bacterium]MCB9732989.1 hypothetical protein [Deltaproteobacteria bacterium]